MEICDIMSLIYKIAISINEDRCLILLVLFILYILLCIVIVRERKKLVEPSRSKKRENWLIVEYSLLVKSLF